MKSISYWNASRAVYYGLGGIEKHVLRAVHDDNTDKVHVRLGNSNYVAESPGHKQWLESQGWKLELIDAGVIL